MVATLAGGALAAGCGFEAAKAGRLWQMAAPGVNAANAAGRKPAVEISQTPVTFSRVMKAPASGFNVYKFDVVSEGGQK